MADRATRRGLCPAWILERSVLNLEEKIAAALTGIAVVCTAVLVAAPDADDAPSTRPAASPSPSPVPVVVPVTPSRAPSPRATRAARSRPLPSPSARRLSVRPQRHAQVVEKKAAGNVRDITMYCDTGSRTASGKWPEPGMVATISRSIPFGTPVHIDGLGTYTVEDHIGHGSEFDIFTHSCAEANRFGRQHRRVTIG